CREAARAKQRPECITSILAQLADPFGAALFALTTHVHSPHVLLRKLDIAEQPLGLGARTVEAHALSDELLRAHLQMKAQFGLDVVEHLGLRAPRETEQRTARSGH